MHPSMLASLVESRTAELRSVRASTSSGVSDGTGGERRRRRAVRFGLRQPLGWLLVDLGLRLAAPAPGRAAAARRQALS